MTLTRRGQGAGETWRQGEKREKPQGIYFTEAKDGRFQPYEGDSYIAAIEFLNPIRARVLNTYGNATQLGAPHIGDQLALSARKELRLVWRDRREIIAHLESRKVF